MRSGILKNRNLFEADPAMKLALICFLFFAGAAGRLRAVEIKEDRKISAKKPVNISSVQLLFQKLQGLTLFKGEVKALHGDLVLTADEIRAFSENNAATAKGHVKVIDKSSAIPLTCGNLEYQDLINPITAHTHPVLTTTHQTHK